MDWGIVSTIKAPLDEVLAFAAYHLDLGATRLWLCFDDPDDPAAGVLENLPRITVLRCDAGHWARLGIARPPRHQNRQTANAQHVLRLCDLDWLLHIDVDEFLHSPRPVADALRDVRPNRPFVRVKAWEALHCPDMGDDIFTSSVFRAPLNSDAQAPHRSAVFGPYEPLFPTGVMSHAVGKCFFRTDVPGLQAWLHGAALNGEKVPPGPHLPGMSLLHFHSQNRQDWLSRLPYRLEKGAYVLKPELATFLKTSDRDEINDFYYRCLTATPEALDYLDRHSLMQDVRLNLRARVAALRGNATRG